MVFQSLSQLLSVDHFCRKKPTLDFYPRHSFVLLKHNYPIIRCILWGFTAFGATALLQISFASRKLWDRLTYYASFYSLARCCTISFLLSRKAFGGSGPSFEHIYSCARACSSICSFLKIRGVSRQIVYFSWERRVRADRNNCKVKATSDTSYQGRLSDLFSIVSVCCNFGTHFLCSCMFLLFQVSNVRCFWSWCMASSMKYWWNVETFHRKHCHWDRIHP